MESRKNTLTEDEKVLTNDEIDRRKLTAEHIKALTDSKKYTCLSLADKIGIAESTIRNYKQKRTSMSADIARLFSEKIGYIPPYWTGETDCKTWQEYQQEIEKAEAAGAAEYLFGERQAENELKIVFSFLGFSFENLSNVPGFDFTPAAKWPNKLTSASEPGISACFDDKELENLISKLRDTIAFECFRKGKPQI